MEAGPAKSYGRVVRTGVPQGKTDGHLKEHRSVCTTESVRRRLSRRWRAAAPATSRHPRPVSAPGPVLRPRAHRAENREEGPCNVKARV